MPLILVVEDNSADVRKAVGAAQLAGFTEFEIYRFATDAKLYLDKALNGTAPLPDAMVLDLNLGVESGFEILRLWHSTPSLKKVPVIVWSILGDREHSIADLFKIYRFVDKEDGVESLSDALRSLFGDLGKAGEKLA